MYYIFVAKYRNKWSPLCYKDCQFVSMGILRDLYVIGSDCRPSSTGNNLSTNGLVVGNRTVEKNGCWRKIVKSGPRKIEENVYPKTTKG